MPASVTEEILWSIFEELKRISTPPILFQSYCEHCGDKTTHISHLSPTRIGEVQAVTSSVSPLFQPVIPLKTCLNCGLLTDKEP